MKGLKDLLLGREEDAESKAGLTGSLRHSVSEGNGGIRSGVGLNRSV